MSGTAICNPEDQQPKQTGAYESAEAQELLASLAQAEPRISQTFLYDEKGSALYEKIVEQKEYPHHRRHTITAPPPPPHSHHSSCHHPTAATTLAATVATALVALTTALATNALAAGTTWSRRRVRSWRGTWPRSPPCRRLARPSRSSGSSSLAPACFYVGNLACVPCRMAWVELAEAGLSLGQP